jgi:hypothetical protein
MKAIIEKNIELLQEKVEMNRQILEKNRIDLRSVIQQPLSNERTEHFIKHFRISLELFSRNYHFIKLQLELNRSKNPNNELKSFGMMSLS